MNPLLIRNECARSSLQLCTQDELMQPIYVQNGAVSRKNMMLLGGLFQLKRRKHWCPGPSSSLHTSTAWCCHQFPAGCYVRKHFWEIQRGGGIKTYQEKERVIWSGKAGPAVIVSSWPLQVQVWYSIQSSCSDRMCTSHRCGQRDY